MAKRDYEAERAELERLLAERLALAQEPSYEGQVLTRGQHWLLATAGLIIPFVMMTIGWVAQ
jgi:predicted anti-sigma-YlaC factor YlaD